QLRAHDVIPLQTALDLTPSYPHFTAAQLVGNNTCSIDASAIRNSRAETDSQRQKLPNQSAIRNSRAETDSQRQKLPNQSAIRNSRAETDSQRQKLP
ncbi:hypothetical protein ACJMK2_037215, partial [Sinanodonta woodiana]